MDKLVELLLYTFQFIEGIRDTAISTEAPELERLEAIVDVIDNFESMGEVEEGKFDLNTIFQKLVAYNQKKDEFKKTKEVKAQIYKNKVFNVVLGRRNGI
jgi:hypothetical protein